MQQIEHHHSHHSRDSDISDFRQKEGHPTPSDLDYLLLCSLNAELVVDNVSHSSSSFALTIWLLLPIRLAVQHIESATCANVVIASARCRIEY